MIQTIHEKEVSYDGVDPIWIYHAGHTWAYSVYRQYDRLQVNNYTGLGGIFQLPAWLDIA
jgi:hypothetical protein